MERPSSKIRGGRGGGEGVEKGRRGGIIIIIIIIIIIVLGAYAVDIVIASLYGVHSAQVPAITAGV